MNKKLLGTMGAFVLVLLLALSSLAAAAPAAKNTPVPHQALTATPVPSSPDDGGAGAADNAPDLDVGAAALAPVNPGPMTSKILVFNLDTLAATVSIKIVKPDGSTVYTFPNFTVAKNGAVAKALPSSIPSPFKGSAVVSSDKNVQAFVTDFNGANTARDEYGGSVSPRANLVLPFVRHLAPNTQNSIIAVQNTSGGPANITLNLFNQSGTAVATQTINSVASNASAYFDTNTIFPSGTFIGSAEISAGGVPLAASEQTRYLKDTASFRALSAGLAPAGDEGTKLYDGFVERQKNSSGVVTRWSELYARNDGGAPTNITVKFYSSAGLLMTAATKTRSPVPPKGLAQFLTNAAEFSVLTKSTSYFKGWAVITSSNSQPMTLYALAARSSGTQLFGTSGIASTGTRFACGDALRIGTPSQYSMINIVNPGGTGTSANVTIQVYKPSGAPGGTKSITVGVNKLMSVSLSDSAFSTAGAEGLAVVKSTGANPAPIFASVFTPFGSGGVTSYNCAGF